MREHRRLTGPWLVHAGGVRINRVQMPVTDGCGDGPGVDPPGGEVGFGVVIGEDRGEAAYLRGLGGGQAGQLVSQRAAQFHHPVSVQQPFGDQCCHVGQGGASSMPSS